MRWRDLTLEERRFVVGAVLAGVHGDVLMPTGRWYRIRSRSSRLAFGGGGSVLTALRCARRWSADHRLPVK